MPAPAAQIPPPREDPSPVLSEAPRQVYQTWPADDDPIDPAMIGIRRSFLPRVTIAPGAVKDLARRVRDSVVPKNRDELKHRLVHGCIVVLRAFRTVLDKTAELTVKLELRLRG